MEFSLLSTKNGEKVTYRRPKTKCEICGEMNKKVLDRHHMVPRSDPNSTNNESNLAIVCANCHRKIHSLEIVIEGLYKTTAVLKLFWHKSGEPHVIRPGIILHKDGTATVIEE